MDNSRTYGIEFETVSSINKFELTIKIQEALAENRTGHTVDLENYGHATNGRNFTKWIVKTDSSLSCSHLGFSHPVEIVSPVLKGKAGLEVIKVVGAVLNKYTKVNKSCGLHTHHGVTETEMRKTCAAWIKAEAVVIKSLPRSRQNNYYSRTWGSKLGYNVSTLGAQEYRTLQNDRYVTLNLQSFTMRSTLEFRCAAGTANAEKAINWLLFTQGFVNAAQVNVPESINTIQKVKEFIAQNVVVTERKSPRSEMRKEMCTLISTGRLTKKQILDTLEIHYDMKRGSINTILNGSLRETRYLGAMTQMTSEGYVKWEVQSDGGVDTDYTTAASWVEYRYNSFAA